MQAERPGGGGDGGDEGAGAGRRFGALLRRHRLAAGLTQEALAERAGLGVRTVQGLEEGEHRPRRETARRLAAALAPAQRAALLNAARPAPRARRDAAAPEPAHPPARPFPAAPPAHDVPVPLTPLVGRERERERLVERVRDADVRLLTLTGPGGVGKTRLALAAAARLGADFPDGVRFVPLAGAAEPAVVLSQLARAVGADETGDATELRRPPAGAEAPEAPGGMIGATYPADRGLSVLIRALRDSTALLVLDNFEQAVGAAPLLVALLAACPRLTLLVTSRVVLRVSGEHVFRLRPLALPAPGAVTRATDLDRYAATALFVQRARAAHPDLPLGDESAAAVAEICRRLDGLPLALELAAARTPLLPPPALLARLERRLTLLTGGARDLPPRQQTLRATIAWSYALLTPDQQAVLRRLGVFAGGASLPDAEEVCAARAA